MRIIFLMNIILAAYGIRIDYPDIEDIFSNLTEIQYPSVKFPGVIVKNISVDIEKLDVEKYMKKMNVFKNQVREEEAYNDTRRQQLTYTFGRLGIYRDASDFLAKQKALDMMLQHIYMARHKIKKLEDDKYFNQRDTGYRIGFLYRKIRRLLKYMMDIYAYMHNNALKFNWIETHTKLHHKCVKLHTDFLYLWWVLVKVDGKYKEATGKRPKLPPRYALEGGISDN